MTLEVLDPGLQATVQDAGRTGLGHLGVPPGGAADPWALAVANALVGNETGAAGVEVTLGPARFRALTDLRLGLAGADLQATVEPRGDPVVPGSSVALAGGDVLVLAGAPPGAGMRAYLAVGGGIDVPVVLGSRSTCLAAGFGGFEGRALRVGDRLPAGPGGAQAGTSSPLDHWPGTAHTPVARRSDGAVELRIVGGPLDPSLAAWLVGRSWVIEPSSDRMGLRLAPTGAGDEPEAAHGARLSHGVTTGTIQVPADGQPIVLLPDHQPTGGYPVAGIVINADRATLGQLAPRDRVGFRLIGLEDARAAGVERRRQFAEALAVAREGGRWAELWGSAGG